MSRAPDSGLVMSAPGKLMISGEYVVLEGAPAVVTAVSRRVRVWCVAQEPESSEARLVPPEAEAAREHAERRWGQHPGRLQLDVSETRAGAQKLGVGSSAAAAAASAALVAVRAGHDLDADGVRRQVLDAALAGHAAVAPRGSGADVAASTLGGFIQVQKRPEGLACGPVTIPEPLVMRVVWTGKQVRTSDMLDRVEALRQAAPDQYRDRMDQLRSAAEGFIQALAARRPEGVIKATRAYHGAMAELGRASSAPIVDDTLAIIAELAHMAGGAAKPSGAGGGDVALALFPDHSAAAKFGDMCLERALDVVQMDLGAEGVRTEPQRC